MFDAGGGGDDVGGGAAGLTTGGGGASTGKSDAASQRGGKGGVVVILKEDARVPPGHVAEAGGARLRERVGLAELRRVARVRVLSSAEGAMALPRLVLRALFETGGFRWSIVWASRPRVGG